MVNVGPTRPFAAAVRQMALDLEQDVAGVITIRNGAGQIVRRFPEPSRTLDEDLGMPRVPWQADPRLGNRPPDWATLTHDTWRDMTDQDISWFNHHWKLGQPWGVRLPQTGDRWQNHPNPYPG